MRIETLLSPGLLSNGILLRREASKAISGVEITAGRTPGGKTDGATKLAAFFTDCASKLSTLVDTVIADFSHVTSATATSATQINIIFPASMDQSVTPAAAAFALSGDTITGVAWTSATNLRLTGTGFAAAESLVYTEPATNGIRDLAGLLVASAAKTLV